MNKRQKIIVSITGITLVLLILVGLTYAYFLTRIQGNTNTKSISVTTADLKLVYGDGNTNIITKEKIQPGDIIGTKDFTVTNEGNSETDYIVVIDDVSITNVTSGDTTTFSSNDFVYTLTCSSSDSISCEGVDDEITLPLVNNSILVTNNIGVGATHNYVLTITYKETGIDQSADMNKKLEAKVDIKDFKMVNPYSNNTSSLAYNIINNAMNLTNEQKSLGYAEFRNTTITPPTYGKSYDYSDLEDSETSNEVTTSNYFIYGDSFRFDFRTTDAGVTCVLINKDGSALQYVKYSEGYQDLIGKYIISTTGTDDITNFRTSIACGRVRYVTNNTTSTTLYTKRIKKVYKDFENTLSVTKDELGNSYYFRGGVTNNYVNFNDMCWRIVRIEGDGSVKLSLASSKGVCDDSNNLTNDSSYIGLAEYSSTSNIFDYDNNNLDYEPNSEIDDNYWGRYSVKSLLNRFLTGGKYVYDWDENTDEDIYITYPGFSNENLNKMKSESICIDDFTNEYDINGNLYTSESSNISIHYKNARRIDDKKTASYVCDMNAERASSSKVFPLTVDEVAYAGASSDSSDYIYYLKDNAQTDSWVTISSSHYSPRAAIAYIYTVSSDGRYSNSSVNSSINTIPAITLVSGTEISGGSGTQSDPYDVE